MIAAGVARRVVTVRPDPVRNAAARLDRVGESLRAMSVTAGGSLTRAAPEVVDESTTAVCDSAAAASRIRLAGFGDWSASLADRLRQAVQLYATADAAAAGTVTVRPGSLPGPAAAGPPPAVADPAQRVPAGAAPAGVPSAAGVSAGPELSVPAGVDPARAVLIGSSSAGRSLDGAS